jgi:hypothetical protein
MKNIVIVDDQDHALTQVMNEFPKVSRNDLAFRHFDSIEAFRRGRPEHIFLLFLDFFLSKDRDYGTSLIPEMECEHLVCFSSMREASDRMYRAAIEEGRERIRHVYSVQKLKGSIENVELHKVLTRIFGSPPRA